MLKVCFNIFSLNMCLFILSYHKIVSLQPYFYTYYASAMLCKCIHYIQNLHVRINLFSIFMSFLPFTSPYNINLHTITFIFSYIYVIYFYFLCVLYFLHMYFSLWLNSICNIFSLFIYFKYFYIYTSHFDKIKHVTPY